MSDEDWQKLKNLAESLASSEAAPTPGQVASQLLHDAIQSLLARSPAASQFPERHGEASLPLREQSVVRYEPQKSLPLRATAADLRRAAAELRAQAGRLEGLAWAIELQEPGD